MNNIKKPKAVCDTTLDKSKLDALRDFFKSNREEKIKNKEDIIIKFEIILKL